MESGEGKEGGMQERRREVEGGRGRRMLREET